jgi:hypothetical protein
MQRSSVCAIHPVCGAVEIQNAIATAHRRRQLVVQLRSIFLSSRFPIHVQSLILLIQNTYSVQ